MSQRLFLAFDTEPSVAPVDPVGWTATAAGVLTYVVDHQTITGRAWQVSASSAVLIEQAGAASAQATASLTLTMGVSVDWPAFLAAAVTTVTLAEHGDDTNSTWRLQAALAHADAKTVQLSLSWRTAAATAWRTVGGPIIKLERPAAIFVSRERTASGFTVRWSVNGEPAGATTSTPIDIVVTSSGSPDISIGQTSAALEVAVGWRFEWIQLLDEASTIEEMVVVGKRFAVRAPMLTTALRRLEPDNVYSRDPDSLIDREIRVEAVAASLVRGGADYLLAGMPPGLSFGPLLERWENTLRPGTAPGAELERRQDALAAQLRLSGSALDEAKIALEPVLGLASADIVIDELDTTEYLEEFNTTTTSGGYLTGGFDAARWVTVGAARFTFALVGGSSLYRVTRALAADDMRYRGRNDYAAPDTSTPFLLHPTGVSGRGTWWEISIVAVTLPATDIIAGLVIGDAEDDDWTWIGLYSDGSSKLGWTRYNGAAGGPVMGAITSLGAATAPRFIRVRDLGGGAYDVQHNATAPADWNAIAVSHVVGASPRARWGGIGAAGGNTSATGAFGVDVGMYWDRAPRGPGRLSWQAFRDPLLPGTYDLEAADLIAQRVSPSHVEGTPITHRRGIYTDDATTLLDRDPMRT